MQDHRQEVNCSAAAGFCIDCSQRDNMPCLCWSLLICVDLCWFAHRLWSWLKSWMHLELSSSQMHNSKHASHIPYFRRLSHFKTRIADSASDNCAISCVIFCDALLDRLWQFASWIQNSAAESLWRRPVLSMASNHTTHTTPPKWGWNQN